MLGSLAIFTIHMGAAWLWSLPSAHWLFSRFRALIAAEQLWHQCRPWDPSLRLVVSSLLTSLLQSKTQSSFETIFDAIFDQNLGVIVDGRMSVATRRLRERRRREIAKTDRWVGLRDLFME